MPAIPASGPPVVSVIVPARNEELNLGACLESLTSQSGIAFEIIVVDDHSTDRTAEIARSLSGVQVIPAPDLPPGWTGKNNAVIAGAARAHGQWLLFTDADTVHLPGSLAASLAEAEDKRCALLSYSPKQIVKTFWERAIMPAVFADLAARYDPDEVSSPSSPVAAANGQFILVRRDAYDAVGGHRAIATEILEDVALARSVKSARYKIFFRYGADRIRTRMYRNFHELREGWTKNLALLFPLPRFYAVWHCVENAAVLGGVVAIWLFLSGRAHSVWLYVGLGLISSAFSRLRRAHFSVLSTVLATLVGGFALAYLLLLSAHRRKLQRVTWKGREYSPAEVNPHSGAGV